MPRVARLSYTPVRALGLLHPDHLDLTDVGVRNDRRFYLVDERGVRGLYRPAAIQVQETQLVEGVRVPRRLSFEDARRGFRVEIEVESAHVSDMRRPRRRWFVQMRGVATVQERGRPIGRLTGFFETYVD